TERGKFFAYGREMSLVAVIDTEKDSAFAWQALACGKLCFCECLTVAGGDAHHFAGGAHLRAENGVYAAKLVEREDGRLDRIIFSHGDFGDAVVMNEWKIHVGKLLSGHQA